MAARHTRSWRGAVILKRTASGRMETDLMNGEDQDRYPPAAEGRDWRRIHHSPVFWVGIVLCLAAIVIYVWSDDLSWRPRIE